MSLLAYAKSKAGSIPTVEEMKSLIDSVMANPNEFGYDEGMESVTDLIPNCSKAVAFRALRLARAIRLYSIKAVPLSEEDLLLLQQIEKGE